MAPKRIQRRRTKGWRMPPNTVSVTRPGKWGNPFVVGKKPNKRLLKSWGWRLRPDHWDDVCPTAEEAVKRFAACIAFDDASHYAARIDLAGKDLACFCPLDQVCHADVLLEIANAPDPHPHHGGV